MSGNSTAPRASKHIWPETTSTPLQAQKKYLKELGGFFRNSWSWPRWRKEIKRRIWGSWRIKSCWMISGCSLVLKRRQCFNNYLWILFLCVPNFNHLFFPLWKILYPFGESRLLDLGEKEGTTLKSSDSVSPPSFWKKETEANLVCWTTWNFEETDFWSQNFAFSVSFTKIILNNQPTKKSWTKKTHKRIQKKHHSKKILSAKAKHLPTPQHTSTRHKSSRYDPHHHDSGRGLWWRLSKWSGY